MTVLLSLLLVLAISKEFLYFNEELLVIISFLSFLTVVSVSIGGLVGTSLDASIREITEGVSSKIVDYTKTLELSRDTLSDQLAASSKCSLATALSLASVFTAPENVSLRVNSLSRVLNVVLARSFVEHGQADTQEHFMPLLDLQPTSPTQSSSLTGSFSPVEGTCLTVLPPNTFILVVVNSLLVLSLR